MNNPDGIKAGGKKKQLIYSCDRQSDNGDAELTYRAGHHHDAG